MLRCAQAEAIGTMAYLCSTWPPTLDPRAGGIARPVTDSNCRVQCLTCSDAAEPGPVCLSRRLSVVVMAQVSVRMCMVSNETLLCVHAQSFVQYQPTSTSTLHSHESFKLTLGVSACFQVRSGGVRSNYSTAWTSRASHGTPSPTPLPSLHYPRASTGAAPFRYARPAPPPQPPPLAPCLPPLYLRTLLDPPLPLPPRPQTRHDSISLVLNGL